MNDVLPSVADGHVRLARSHTRPGFSNVAVYDGSLQEWTLNPDNPLEVD
jgi:3-mercaptopyruvate sulfurtransferase SseA